MSWLSSEPARDAGADLRRVAVDRLLAGEDDVGRAPGFADLADRLSERVARRQSIGAGEEAVGEQHPAVRAEGQRLAQGVLGRRRSHRQHRHFAAVLVAQPQRRLQREKIIGVDDRRHALAHDRVGDGMDADLRRVRNLLDANDEMHGGLRGDDLGPLHACTVPSRAKSINTLKFPAIREEPRESAAPSDAKLSGTRHDVVRWRPITRAPPPASPRKRGTRQRSSPLPAFSRGEAGCGAG